MSLAQLTLLPLLLLELPPSLLLVLSDPTSLLSSPVQLTLHVSWCMLAALLLLVRWDRAAGGAWRQTAGEGCPVAVVDAIPGGAASRRGASTAARSWPPVVAVLT